MIARWMSAMAFVILVTMLGGALGGLVGREVGKLSPQLMETLAAGKPQGTQPTFQPDQFGLGLGIISGLFFGAGSSLVIVLVMAWRDVWLAKLELRKRFE
jgi:hypothetical protein